MPYKGKKDLPTSIHHVLPDHAQDIYLKAFNNAWEEYKNPNKRRTDDDRETVAHKVAWAAVKAKYKKVGDMWEEKKS